VHDALELLVVEQLLDDGQEVYDVDPADPLAPGSDASPESRAH
jgi:hypothetical protein